MSAVACASDPLYALIDSGATNALRPGDRPEIQGARVIRVDLASGVAELHVNKHGTGFSISWRSGGCSIRRRGEAPLEVKVIKGCPLIPKEKGLQLVKEYEDLKESGDLVSLKRLVEEGGFSLGRQEARGWLAQRVVKGGLSRQDQLTWLYAMFPQAPWEYLVQAAGQDAVSQELSSQWGPLE